MSSKLIPFFHIDLRRKLTIYLIYGNFINNKREAFDAYMQIKAREA